MLANVRLHLPRPLPSLDVHQGPHRTLLSRRPRLLDALLHLRRHFPLGPLAEGSAVLLRGPGAGRKGPLFRVGPIATGGAKLRDRRWPGQIGPAMIQAMTDLLGAQALQAPGPLRHQQVMGRQGGQVRPGLGPDDGKAAKQGRRPCRQTPVVRGVAIRR